MSNIKKLLALVLALTMVLSISAFAGYTVAPYGDAAQVDEDCEVAVQTLYSMDIMKGDDKGNFRPEATITRAEVAKMIYVILNYGDDDKAVNFTGAKIFSDVAAGAWYEGYVNYAATTKLVNGRPDGTFGPNDPVTTAEAAKMLLTAIGYSAEARGYIGAGWDKQVLADASIIGLLNDYDYNTMGYAPRQWVAVMFYNALTEAYTYGTIAPVVFNGLLTGTNLPAYEYKTMGEKYYNMKYFKGVVTANEYANLYGAEGITSGRTILDNNGIKLKVDTDLDDLGERRWGWYNTSNNVVYYFGDTGTNKVFSTGDATTIAKKYVGVYVDEAEYFVNFDKADSYGSSVNGDWLKVIDYNNDGDADYVFKTTFTMGEVKGLSKGGVLTLTAKDGTVKFDDGDDYIEFVTESKLAYDDVVLYTVIDGVCYVELAPTFTGKVDKYTYKSNVLTVAGEDYTESAIAQYTSCIEVIANARKNIEYTYYQDFFGHIRVYSRSVSDDGELLLLTDAYYETNRAGDVYAVYAYMNGEIVDCDVDPTYSNINKFFTEATNNNNAWGRLKAYEGSTHIARYTEDEDGLTIMDATTHYYDKTGAEAGIKSGYVNLKNQDVKAGATAYVAEHQDSKVQANKDTVYYYVSYDAYGNMIIDTVTGYKNSYDVVAEYVGGINAMYAVATRIDEDAAGKFYYVADVIVIETASPVFNLNNNIVLGYNVVNKTVNDFAALDVIGADGALDTLNVISYNGNKYNDFNNYKYLLDELNFYWNTEDEDADSHIREIPASAYAANGIFTATVDRVNDLYEYVVADDANSTVLTYDENTIVYNLTKNTNYVAITTEDSYGDPLTLTTGSSYIVFADEDNYVVYAVLVESYSDVAADLYAKIAGEPADALGKAKADAAKALADYAAEVVAKDGWGQAADVTADDLAATVAAEQAKIAAATTESAVETALTAAKEAVWQKALAVQAEINKANATYTLSVTNNSKRGIVINNKAYEMANDSVTGLKAGEVLTLTSGVNVTVSGSGDVEVVMGADMQHWTITVKGNGTIRISLAN